MANLSLIRCHKILDNRKVEEVVEIVECLVIEDHFVEFTVLKVSEIPMYVINGENDTLKDNGRACPLFSNVIIII